MSLETLDIAKQKDEIIARLMLQKCEMYIAYTEKWLDELLSANEAFHVYHFATESDKEFYHSYQEILGYIKDGVWVEEVK